jgi:hypothetical protein
MSAESPSVATNAEDHEARNGDELEKDQKSPGNWLGRWVLMLAIVAFLVVYVIQLWRGTGLFFTILLATAAMAAVGAGGMAVRQMVLRTASQDRAASILAQMQRLRNGGNAGFDEDEGA